MTQLNEHRLHTLWQQKLYSKLVGLQYKIICKQGCDNSDVDALSRVLVSSKCRAISHCTPLWIKEVIQGYNNDPGAKDLLAKLAIHPEPDSYFTLKDGLIRYK